MFNIDGEKRPIGGAALLDDCVDPCGPDHVRAAIDDIIEMLGARTPPDARQQPTGLVNALGLESTLAGVGVRTPAQVIALAASASPIRLATNPRGFNDLSLADFVTGID